MNGRGQRHIDLSMILLKPRCSPASTARPAFANLALQSSYFEDSVWCDKLAGFQVKFIKLSVCSRSDDNELRGLADDASVTQ
jgi:hypothetical protein